MTEFAVEIVIAAPADRVWDVVGHHFDRIGEWSTAVPASAATAGDGGFAVPGRVCRTGTRLAPEVTETLTAYDDAGRTLTYEAAGLPAFVVLARSTWTVVPIDDRRCRLRLRARFETRGAAGVLGRWAIRVRAHRAARHLAGDLGHYAVTGVPSRRKQRRLRGAARGPG
jgi:hypothetical protein